MIKDETRPTYNFDIIDRLRFSGLAKDRIDRLNKQIAFTKEVNLDDRDPSKPQPINQFSSRTSYNDGEYYVSKNGIDASSAFSWYNNNDNGNFLPENERLLYCDLTSYSISRNKTIVMTNIVGSKSSIKEFINEEDYSITLNGSFINDAPDVIPILSTKRINEMVGFNGPIYITNNFMNDQIGIQKIIITGMSLQQSNVGNVQNFNIQAVTDF